MASFEYSFDEQILAPSDNEIVRVVFTMPLNEGRLSEYCRAHGIVSYLPLRKAILLKRKKYKDKSYQYQNIVLRPMFPGYLFVKLSPDQRSELFRSQSVVRILGDTLQNQGKLLEEIRLVKQIEEIAKTDEVEFNAQLKEGDKFFIESGGPWQGSYGWLKKKRKRFLWTIEIECLNTLVQATIDPSMYKMTPVSDFPR